MQWRLERGAISGTQSGMETDDKPNSADGRGNSARRGFWEWSGNPLVSSLVAVGLTGLLGTYLASWFTEVSHKRDVEAATRTDALASVKDISDLINERRERAALVASSIRRAASEAEIDGRKHAYDEAYVAWNAKAPGDLLRVRAALQSAYTSTFERYIDGLANATMLLHGTDAATLLHAQQQQSEPGIFSIMDSCLTSAYDSYRMTGYKSADAGRQILLDCKFQENYRKAIFCFSSVAETMYSAINVLGRAKDDPDYVPGPRLSDADIVEACRPPPGVTLTPASPPPAASH